MSANYAKSNVIFLWQDSSDRGKTMDTRDEVLRSLAQIPYFKHVAEEKLASLASLTRPRHLKKGDLVFAADQVCRHLHILRSGEIKVYVVSELGREQIIHLLKPLVFFGEEILFGENRYEANAQALCKTTLYDIDKKDLEGFILSNPQVGIAMLAYFGERLKRLMKMIGDMALKDVQFRLLCRLVQMADEEGEKTEDGIAINGLSQEELAAHVGTVREHLNRCLTRLQNARLIKLGRKRIIVQDIDALRDLSQNHHLGIPTHSKSVISG
jgi:CRP-like cAMP-binding protein